MKLFNEAKLNIFVGAYGSGKSEISVNAARIMKETNPESKVLLADLDIVNPFYRSADAVKKLSDLDIRVISPSFANSNVDVPALSGEMYSIFDDDSYVGVYDIGGEDLGANVLGTLQSRLKNFSCNLFMVVNTLRPFTSDVMQILEMTMLLEESSKMKINGYINNTNLLQNTDVNDVLKGEEMLIEAGKQNGIPLVLTTLMEDMYDNINLNDFKASEVIKLIQTITYDY